MIFCWGDAKSVFKVTVKTAKRIIAAFQGTLQNAAVGIVKQVAGTADTVFVGVGVKGNACNPFENAGKVRIVVACLMCKVLKFAVFLIVFFNKVKYFLQQIFIAGKPVFVFCVFIKLGTDGVENPLFFK